MTDFTLANGKRVHLIGDPHLGRKFESGVPSHRRGERESMQSSHFASELEVSCDINIMVGDLFDNPHVSQFVIVSAARAFLSAAERNPDITYIAMAGNHDVPRNISVVGAWTAFRRMVEGRLPNVVVATQPLIYDQVAVFPWEWGERADDQVDRMHFLYAGDRGNGYLDVSAAVGHWDLAVYDGKDDHLAPVRQLHALFPALQGVYSGHYHVAGTYALDGGDVVCTGSLEPYTHGEDPEGKLYVTLTATEALERDDLRQKYVRILLTPGEEMPEIDCLGLTHKRVSDDEEKEEVTVSIQDFDFQKLVVERIQKRDPVVRDFISERMSLNVQATSEQC